MAQAPHEPTPQTRALVQQAAGMGLPQPMICQLMRLAGAPVSEPTLLKYYHDELKGGEALATLEVAKTLYHKATAEKNLGAAIFWLKARAGWREKHVLDDDPKRTEWGLAELVAAAALAKVTESPAAESYPDEQPQAPG